MIIRPFGTEFFRADKQADITKLTIPLRNFANAPENDVFCFHKTFSFHHR
jgi:hypothetical protein